MLIVWNYDDTYQANEGLGWAVFNWSGPTEIVIDPPFYLDAAQLYLAGGEAGQLYQAGGEPGQTYVAGAEAAEVR